MPHCPAQPRSPDNQVSGPITTQHCTCLLSFTHFSPHRSSCQQPYWQKRRQRERVCVSRLSAQRGLDSSSLSTCSLSLDHLTAQHHHQLPCPQLVAILFSGD
jgi:hypothetical protein